MPIACAAASRNGWARDTRSTPGPSARTVIACAVSVYAAAGNMTTVSTSTIVQTVSRCTDSRWPVHRHRQDGVREPGIEHAAGEALHPGGRRAPAGADRDDSRREQQHVPAFERLETGVVQPLWFRRTADGARK